LRATIGRDEKMRIGKLAASFVEDGDAIVIDAGTTTIPLAEEVSDRRGITVATPSLRIASLLSERAEISSASTRSATTTRMHSMPVSGITPGASCALMGSYLAFWESAADEGTEFVYPLEWPDEETKHKAWEEFMADEEGKEIKRTTGAQPGRLVGEIVDKMLRPTSYSPAGSGLGRF
jgi:hypothetical protein